MAMVLATFKAAGLLVSLTQKAISLQSLLNGNTKNKKHFRRLQNHVNTIVKILEMLNRQDVDESAVKASADQLNSALTSANELVIKYANSNQFKKIFQSKTLSNKLESVYEELGAAERLLTLALNVEQRNNLCKEKTMMDLFPVNEGPVMDPYPGPVMVQSPVPVMDCYPGPVMVQSPGAVIDCYPGPVMVQSPDPVMDLYPGPVMVQSLDPVMDLYPGPVMVQSADPVMDLYPGPVMVQSPDPVMDLYPGPVMVQYTEPAIDPYPGVLAVGVAGVMVADEYKS